MGDMLRLDSWISLGFEAERSESRDGCAFRRFRSLEALVALRRDLPRFLRRRELCDDLPRFFFLRFLGRCRHALVNLEARRKQIFEC